MMTMDREKERELELESAMYTNCLLLGLDPNVIGLGASNGTPRVGLFRHSNPKLGEQLLYFILSSLRGPAQSSKVRLRFLSTDSVHLSRSLVRNRFWEFWVLNIVIVSLVMFRLWIHSYDFGLFRSLRISIRSGQFSIRLNLAISVR